MLQLPGPEKATAVVRCCPVLFELLPRLTSEGMDQGGPSLFRLGLAHPVVLVQKGTKHVSVVKTQLWTVE